MANFKRLDKFLFVTYLYLIKSIIISQEILVPVQSSPPVWPQDDISEPPPPADLLLYPLDFLLPIPQCKELMVHIIQFMNFPPVFRPHVR